MVLTSRGDDLPSAVSGGSEGTIESVFLQFGHMKQLRAHLHLHPWSAPPKLFREQTDLFFSALTLALGTSNKQLGQ